MDLFNKVTLKHFNFLRFVAQNIDDDHVMCKITTIARSDRIDTPYYMDVHFALTFCSDIEDKGIYHAMDILKNQRLYNLTEDTYNTVVSSFINSFENVNDERIKLRIEEKLNQIEIQTTTSAELLEMLDKYEDFFNMIDSLN
ncbi:MAG: hypothetical protein BZ137_02090 [Methanosphaera sp. rholeuAM130]|nr:hypothetical protein [Methanosphaera sp.]RAP54443.1 MAG: hypothetical protein BZ137_02090 [Methanosphaera sp. rholeuAM130]